MGFLNALSIMPSVILKQTEPNLIALLMGSRFLLNNNLFIFNSKQ